MEGGKHGMNANGKAGNVNVASGTLLLIKLKKIVRYKITRKEEFKNDRRRRGK